MALADAVKRLRNGRKWKQQELARRSGLSQGMIASIETAAKDNPTQETLGKLALAFDMSVPMLLREAGLEYTRERPELPGLDALAPEFAAIIRRDGAKLTPGQWKIAAAFLEWLAAQGPQESAAFAYQAPQGSQVEDAEKRQESA